MCTKRLHRPINYNNWFVCGVVLDQWIGGFVTFLFPQLRGSMRATVMPYHIYFGFLGYMLAVLAALMGLAEKASFHM